jgi:aspartyl-tRNA(Asn)/glutamyl-tRNA(Gln) amidotransferase subunit A
MTAASQTQIPLSVQDAAARLRSGEITSVGLTEAVFARADDLDAEIGTYLVRFDDTALAAAARADQELASGVDRGPFHGIPVGVKDILAAAEGPTTAQSLILDPAWGAGKDAPIVRRLRQAGAVITGKVTTMEFAIGMPDPTKPFPIPRNPWDVRTWPGGSSSGTGNGIAAGLFLAGIGTDTGGSIRIPAAFCGVSGLMPTFGRVPKSGCTPLGFSLDHIGPLARSAWDCAAMLQILAGYDPSDPDCKDVPVPSYLDALGGSLKGMRIGVERAHHFPEGSDPAAGPSFEAAVSALGDLGATLVEVELPYFAEVNAATMITMASEALAYHRQDMRTRWNDYFAQTKPWVTSGALVSGADYVQAQRVRRVAQHELQHLFANVDAVITPTAVCGALSYDELEGDAIGKIFNKIFTTYWDGVGNPVLVVPMGFTAASLPLSLQIAARPFEENVVLRIADAYQRVTAWHQQVPPLVREPVAA